MDSKKKVSDDVIATYEETLYTVNINNDGSATVKRKFWWQEDIRKSQYLSDILWGERQAMSKIT